VLSITVSFLHLDIVLIFVYLLACITENEEGTDHHGYKGEFDCLLSCVFTHSASLPDLLFPLLVFQKKFRSEQKKAEIAIDSMKDVSQEWKDLALQREGLLYDLKVQLFYRKQKLPEFKRKEAGRLIKKVMKREKEMNCMEESYAYGGDITDEVEDFLSDEYDIDIEFLQL